jgi:hypothetical protein
MKGKPVLLWTTAAFLGCAGTSSSAHGSAAAVDRSICSKLHAALAAAVQEREHATGFGVDAVCVRQVAEAQGKIFVDVVPSSKPERCELPPFDVRVQPESAAPTESVVFLTLQAQNGFQVSVLPATWQRDLKEGYFWTSPCGVANGKFEERGGAWNATLNIPSDSD